MPVSASTVRGLERELALPVGTADDAELGMRRIDRHETDEVCRHLTGRRCEPRPAEGARR